MRPMLTTPPPTLPNRGRITTPPPMRPGTVRRNRFYGLGRTSTSPMRAGRQFAGFGAAQPISDTGMKGFLKWAKQQYPAAIYQQIATQIQQQIPQAFSTYMLGGWRKYAKMNGLADGTTGTVDTSDAANSTPSSPSWSDEISQIIGTATGAFVNIAQAQNQQAIVQAQLQQAQAGKAPLPISLSSSGITFGSTTGMTLGGLLLLGGLGYFVLKAAKVI